MKISKYLYSAAFFSVAISGLIDIIVNNHIWYETFIISIISLLCIALGLYYYDSSEINE